MKLRDMSQDTADATKARVAQHSLFVQVDGTNELMRYLLLHIKLSPTAYAPSGISARILQWCKEQQHEVDIAMVSTEERTFSCAVRDAAARTRGATIEHADFRMRRICTERGGLPADAS